MGVVHEPMLVGVCVFLTTFSLSVCMHRYSCYVVFFYFHLLLIYVQITIQLKHLSIRYLNKLVFIQMWVYVVLLIASVVGNAALVPLSLLSHGHMILFLPFV